jgi:hypothetical protein
MDERRDGHAAVTTIEARFCQQEKMKRKARGRSLADASRSQGICRRNSCYDGIARTREERP